MLKGVLIELIYYKILRHNISFFLCFLNNLDEAFALCGRRQRISLNILCDTAYKCDISIWRHILL